VACSSSEAQTQQTHVIERKPAVTTDAAIPATVQVLLLLLLLL
jgi:hypothetical protein